ncbi:YciI family protein [Mucilaginibacter boryungensis]|uniref:Transcription initiation protein n=1 Tax=Mucilaginibacter boryungensis TaxID=768480 RepID=A0ABR9XN51_9SPHI|nr:YciI family protein [Mucilaginibacter boryungensis]MBE9668798.1 transcription initiation protein [Mucilaginibacter boryungensis]
MKNFLFLYRADYNAMPERTPEQMQATTQRWMDWIGSIAAQNHLVDRGNRLESTGKVLSGNNVETDGPFTEIKEALMGYSVVNADNYEQAMKLAAGCPILPGGSIEVREISVM